MLKSPFVCIVQANPIQVNRFLYSIDYGTTIIKLVKCKQKMDAAIEDNSFGFIYYESINIVRMIFISALRQLLLDCEYPQSMLLLVRKLTLVLAGLEGFL